MSWKAIGIWLAKTVGAAAAEKVMGGMRESAPAPKKATRKKKA